MANEVSLKELANNAPITGDTGGVITRLAALSDGLETTYEAIKDAFDAHNHTPSTGGRRLGSDGAHSFADGAITTAKLAASSATTAKISDGAVTPDKLMDAIVTRDQLGSAEVAVMLDASGLEAMKVTYPGHTSIILGIEEPARPEWGLYYKIIPGEEHTWKTPSQYPLFHIEGPDSDHLMVSGMGTDTITVLNPKKTTDISDPAYYIAAGSTLYYRIIYRGSGEPEQVIELGGTGTDPDPGPSPGQGSVVLERAWTGGRPATTGQRVRLLYDGSDIIVTYSKMLSGSSRLITKEDLDGNVLWSRTIGITSHTEFYPVITLEDGELLYRDGTTLRKEDAPVASGAFEAYAGIANGSDVGIIAWQPCVSPPCAANLYYSGSFTADSWPKELYGVDLYDVGGGQWALATRENPTNRGWTLRLIDASDFATSGTVTIVSEETWNPPVGYSLEDPLIVRQGIGVSLIGTAYSTVLNAPSGKVFLATHLSPTLTNVLQVGRQALNAEITACYAGLNLYVAAEMADNTTGLFKDSGSGLVWVSEVAGRAPSLAYHAADDVLYLANSTALYSLANPAA